ncbi:hypothetical protein A2U01_0044689, partial [Trifolium medium]|nr:hypothetical protein [Trifolium medium]
EGLPTWIGVWPSQKSSLRSSADFTLITTPSSFALVAFPLLQGLDLSVWRLLGSTMLIALPWLIELGQTPTTTLLLL